MEMGPPPTINLDLPMPSDSELDAKFSELVVSITESCYLSLMLLVL